MVRLIAILVIVFVVLAGCNNAQPTQPEYDQENCVETETLAFQKKGGKKSTDKKDKKKKKKKDDDDCD
jgi:hypothetical protein